MDEEEQKKKHAIFLLKEYFSKGRLLKRELEIYKSISDPSSITKNIAEKVLNESKKQFEKLDKEEIFQEQTKLLKEINSYFIY